jgi:hypothetical protein
MPGDASPWDPNDWERHIQSVLKLRYAQPVGSYQHIADEIKGDCGLEGFAVDGTAYQCYACQNWNDFSVLLDHQKNKMTLDISKLLRNEAELLKLLGDIRIGIWNFVLPFWNDKELLKHARKKEGEVRTRKPKHTRADFRIAVITGEEFLVEKKVLAKHDLYQFDVKTVPDIVPTAATWMEQNKDLELVTNLTRKANIITKGKSAKVHQGFLNQMVKDYTSGSIILSKLQQDVPEVYEEVIKKKTDREGELLTASATNTLVPGKFFDETLNQYKAELRGVSGISPRAVDVLAREAVSDWLLRCPLEVE